MKFSEYIIQETTANKPFQTLQALMESADADGTVYFDPSAVQAAYKQNHMSRETVIHLSPSQFLALARYIGKPDATKQARVLKALDEGQKFSDLCYLTTTTDADGNLKVDGHEGRHRAMALRDLGVRVLPVILVSGPGDGGSYRWGNTEQRPKRIYAEDSDTSIPMPPIETYK